jgi:predicted alpha/beta superfamily hydrolase
MSASSDSRKTLARARTLPTRFVVVVPPGTPRHGGIFVSGSAESLGFWNGSGAVLSLTGDRVYSATVELPLGEAVEFKVTRGNWETVEATAYGQEIPNRVHEVRAPQVLEVKVAGWQDHHQHPPRPQKIAGTVDLFELSSRALRGHRRCWVYAPPASCGPGPFPLLMCLDGQNSFHWGRAADSMPVSWSLDVTADRLIREGKMAPVVIGALANAGARRVVEYTPWKDPFRRGGGEARRTLTALRDEFMPAIAERYPARLAPATNGILGSSLGGLFSLWAALQEPPLFTRSAVVSPAFFWGLVEVHEFIRKRRLAAGVRVWMDVGTNEIVSVANVFQDLYLALVRGVNRELEQLGQPPGTKLHYEEFELAGHNEADWAARADRILKYLYPPV